MAVLTEDSNRQSRGGPGSNFRYLVGTDIIYKGAIVMVDSAGNLLAGADAAAGQCVGIADEKIDNSGGASSIFCRVTSGRAFLLPATSLAQTDVGTIATIVDDNEVEIAAVTTNDVAVGYIIEFVSATSVWVFIPVGGYNAA